MGKCKKNKIVNGVEAYAARDKVRAVMEAAQSGDVDMLRGASLQFEGGDLSEVKDGNGRCALHFAAQLGHLALCEAAVKEYGLQVNAEDGDGLTPLALACVGGHLETIQKLIELGAHVHGSDNSDIQPLHHASAAGNLAVVEYLVSQGADIHAHTSAGPPLLWAAGAGKRECVTFFLDAGADPNTKSPDGVTALIMATASGCYKSVCILIDRGADAQLMAVGGVTALHVAFGSNTDEVALELIKKLIEAGGNPNIADEKGNLPIYAAASEGCRQGVEFLFPLTSQPEGISDDAWSVDALMKMHYHPPAHDHPPPVGFAVQIEIPKAEIPDKDLFDQLERQGNEAFVVSNMDLALEHYTKALTHWTEDTKVWANRAAVYLRLGKPELALEDSRRARTLEPTNVKAWYREGCSLRDMRRWEEAALTFYEGLQIDPENKALTREFQKVIMEGRKEHKLHGDGGCCC